MNIILIWWLYIKNQIVSIKCSLLFRDDIEIIDAYRIMKVDGYSRGLMQNIFWFWNLIIEQQKDDSKVYHFMPKPYRILLIIQKQRDNLLADRKKKYIVPEEDIQQEKRKKHRAFFFFDFFKKIYKISSKFLRIKTWQKKY